MNEINYALAPAGATHLYENTWQKLEGSRWYVWIADKWRIIGGLRSDGYEPIPERQQALNRLADVYLRTTHVSDSDVVKKGGFSFTYSEYKKRRKERIEAGLIKENNDLADVNGTDVVEMEDDLTWLAKNVDSWPTGTAVLVSVDDRKTMTFNPRMNDYYSMREWLQRRRELGLIDEPKEKEDEGTKEFDGWHDFNESQPCEELREYLVYVQRTEGDGYLAISVWHDGKWWKTSQMPMPFKVTHFMEVPKPPQIKTPEQIAAEKRDAWIDSTLDEIRHWPKSFIPDRHVIGHIYDALLSGDLESPKGYL